ncbi:MAG: dipeptide epimerase [Deltaproteobacteria bacterium RIFOXYA12_FULL_58_15]|nr:MAG: dipeptide epimerase [Deltaproteobacteria bacterium RIFOXYA12_FULL_58_15]
MRITCIEAWPVPMGLEEPYTIAYETIDKVVNVFCRIETNTKICGYGCAAPDLRVTGETPEGALETFDGIIKYNLKGSDPLRAVKITERVKKALPNQPSVRAAIDMALYDILGKVAGLPAWRLLGGFRDRIRTSMTIGILDEGATVHRAKEYVNRGFHILKLKGGLDMERDIQRVKAVRDAVGPKIALRFDANQGYTLDESVRFVTATRAADIEILEQPTPCGQPDLLRRVTADTAIPIMADESLMTLRDAFRVAKRGLADMVNVKLMKVGGIEEALHINSVSRAAGVQVMVGCMDEAALGIAAGLHFALARPTVKYADLDGHIGLEGDPSAGVVILRDGTLFPSDLPGLGYVPKS